MLPQDTPKKEDKAEDSEEEVTAGIAGVSVSGGQAAAPAPFTFNPAPKGQSPFAAGGMAAPAAPMFSFPSSGAPAGGAAQPNFSFNFAASQTKPDENKDGGDDDDEDDEDDEDPVEMFIKSLPDPVQKCVAALGSLDDEVSELEAQFRKEMRALERKVRATLSPSACMCALLTLACCFCVRSRASARLRARACQVLSAHVLQYEALEAPLFKKRADIVSGNTKPEGLTDTQGIKGVPEFWLGAMRNCSAIAGNITEKDEVIPYSTAGQSLALSLSVCSARIQACVRVCVCVCVCVCVDGWMYLCMHRWVIAWLDVRVCSFCRSSCSASWTSHARLCQREKPSASN